jgi:hypothetical protein
MVGMEIVLGVTPKRDADIRLNSRADTLSVGVNVLSKEPVNRT